MLDIAVLRCRPAKLLIRQTDVRLPSDVTITLGVDSSWTVAETIAWINWHIHQLSHTSHRSVCSSVFPSGIKSASVVRLTLDGFPLHDERTLADCSIPSKAVIRAHQSFDYRRALGRIEPSLPDTQRIQCQIFGDQHRQTKKRKRSHSSMRPLFDTDKRQKADYERVDVDHYRLFSLNLRAGLETTAHNAARYGLEEAEMVKVLESLDAAFDDMDLMGDH